MSSFFIKFRLEPSDTVNSNLMPVRRMLLEDMKENLNRCYLNVEIRK